MAGEERLEQVTAYLSRLMGEPLTDAQPIRLRSVHRAALGAWARKQGLALRLSVISSTTPFTIQELFGDGVAAPVAAAPLPTPVAQVPTMGALSSTVSGIGIDIEEVENLPEADDYREHPFFQDNFTSAEVAYCLRQIDVRASFCGTWAAKEAVLKSGLVSAPSGSLKNIEIRRDRVGRAVFPQCSLSISHTPKTAVAVCLATSVISQPVEASASSPVLTAAVTEPEITPPTAPEAAPKGRWPWSR